MTVRLSPDSPRATVARAFGRELARAIIVRKASVVRLAEAAGTTKSSIANWKVGHNLPRVATATRLAQALSWPRLVEIVRTGRTGDCARCGRQFVNEGGANKVFCSEDCGAIARQLARPTAGALLADTLQAALDRKAGIRGGIPKDVVAEAVAQYRRSDARRTVRKDRLAEHDAALQTAIDTMCRSCEPGGTCQTEECPLRAYSPLVRRGEAVVREIRPRMDRSPEVVARRAEATRAANAERWARPGERERQAAQSAAMWAARTPEERTAMARRIRAGKVAS